MKQLTEILPDVFVVEVPEDAYNFKMLKAIYAYALRFSFGEENEEIYLRPGDWQYLGYCTKDEISFDVSELVEEYDSEHGGDGFANKEQSFRSLLLKHGLFWRNPLDTPEEIDFRYKSLEWHKWQQNEANKLTGKLAVLKKVK